MVRGRGVSGTARTDRRDRDEREAGGGNIKINLVGRTVASGDAVHAVALFVIRAGALSETQRHHRHASVQEVRGA
ncbi:MAG: hypothetical protein M3P70_02790 [Actinomycetota bacterium]|nr:hypothetical protein [Actinomycetota bacterium]